MIQTPANHPDVRKRKKAAAAQGLWTICLVSGLSVALGWVMWSLQADDEHSGRTAEPSRAGVFESVSPAGDTTISLDRFTDLVNTRSAVIVDARPFDRYQAGHVPGAVHIPPSAADGNAESAVLESFDKALPVVVYCESRRCSDSTKVARWLQQSGIERVWVFAGGWEAWQERSSLRQAATR